MRLIEDALERALEVPERPARIVSLVPSITELLFDLGAGDRVAGVSRYCTEPAGVALDGVARIGGQKDPDLDAICALRPDLVLCVKEENLARDVDALAARGVPVYVGDVRSVEDAVGLLGEVADLVDAAPARAEAVAAAVRAGLDEARAIAAGDEPLRLFCPVWRDPWITISPDTYMFDVIRICGGEAIAPGRHQHAGRYPKVTLGAVREAGPSLLLLPDEPYAFSARDAAELGEHLPGVPARLVDGKLLAWYGGRLAGLPALAALLRAARAITGGTGDTGGIQPTDPAAQRRGEGTSRGTLC